MDQEIRFCTSADGVRLAYARTGEGPPIVRIGTFLTHLEYDWLSPIWRPWLENFARFHTLYRYDARGCGLSDWEVDDFSLEAILSDLETVVDAAELERFTLFGQSQGGGASIRYAAKHPDRVSHLIIYGGYLHGPYFGNPNLSELEEVEIRNKLFQLAWAKDNLAYRQVFTTVLLPEGTTEQIRWLTDLQRISTSPENAVKLSNGYDQINAIQEAASLNVPTLVLHARDDMAVSFEDGREIAAHIPGARFVPLASKNHFMLPSEPAWRQFWPQLWSFLGIPASHYQHLWQPAPASTEERIAQLSLREREVLQLIAQGYRNGDIAARLTLAPKTVRNYVSHIFEKLEVSSRGEAIVLARQAGFG